MFYMSYKKDEIGTITMQNKRNEYLFISKLYSDDAYTHVVLCDRNGIILRSYDLPIPLNVTKRAMVKAGWVKVDF